MSRFRLGDRIQWPGQGLGLIEFVADKDGQPHFLLKMDSGITIGVPVRNADNAIWPLPTRPDAERLRAMLFRPCAPDPRPWEERYMDFESTLINGTLDDYVALACRIMAGGATKSFGEKRIFMVMEDNLFAPIAEVLEENRAALIDAASNYQRQNALAPRVPEGVPRPR